MEQLCAGSSEIKFVFQPEKLCLCCGCGPDSDSSSGGAQFILHCEIPLFRKLMKTLYMSMIFIQFSCIMIPLFLQMNSLHMLNKLTPLALLYAIMQVPFSVFLLGGFMEGIAREYEEAAMLDGCGYLRTLVSIIVPLAKPGVVTVLMLSAMGIWNEYIVALVMISDPAKQTVPVGVAALFEVQRYSTDWGALFAALVLVLIPTVVLYAIGQRYLIEGINVGGVKG